MEVDQLKELLDAGLEAASKGLGGQIVKDAYEELKGLFSRAQESETNDESAEIEEKLNQAALDLVNKLQNAAKGSDDLFIEKISALKNINIDVSKLNKARISSVTSKQGSIFIKNS